MANKTAAEKKLEHALEKSKDLDVFLNDIRRAFGILRGSVERLALKAVRTTRQLIVDAEDELVEVRDEAGNELMFQIRNVLYDRQETFQGWIVFVRSDAAESEGEPSRYDLVVHKTGFGERWKTEDPPTQDILAIRGMLGEFFEKMIKLDPEGADERKRRYGIVE